MWVLSRKKYEEYSDEELIGEFKRTNKTKFLGVLFERYSHLVFGGCMKYLKDEDESKDATMQVFEKLMTDLKTHQVNSFKSWLYIVVKNHCLMKLRTSKKMQKITIQEEFMESEAEEHHSNEKEVELSKLETCLKKLKEQQRKCVELFYLKEKCYQEVAELTKYSMVKVKSYLQNGKRNLKICMSGNNA
ncbi:sigma-70 family RNA polymerase sigma factor [bacterium AH-315-C07]|nr:sigma-70 family RNA polymerase sigma factor [bacterium AH-315-C07]